MRFLQGRTLTEAEVREQQNLERILSLVQTCHTEIPKHFQGPALVFWPFHVCRNYIQTAREGNSRMMDALPRLLDINAELEKTVAEIKLVFGHNDLLAANFIDDGKRLWLLDWDYAGYDAALFDLANLSSNNELSLEQEDWLLETYFQRKVTDRLRRKLMAMKCVSLLRETLWSINSEIYSTLDHDFVSYTKKNLTRFDRTYETFQQMR
jgi:thiamine kinase-like enzyme